MTRNRQFAIALASLAALIVAPAWAQAGSVRDHIAVLRSDAGNFEKARACQELAILGSPEAVPALATLLADEQLAAYARTALEAIPDGSAGQALMAALPRLTGTAQAGVISSLGARRERAAVEPLIALVSEPDAAEAALVALGRIATPEATRFLARFVPTAGPFLRGAAAEASLACAETCADAGRRAEAMALYQSLRGRGMPPHIRLAAIAGAMVLRGDASAPLLGAYLRSGDVDEARMALRTARKLPGPAVTGSLVRALDGVSADRKVQIISALAERPDGAAGAAILRMAADEDPAVRLAALEALGTFDDDVLVFVPLFDGETFQGWEGDTETFFRIEEGAIVGGNLHNPIPQNEFLCTTQRYGNFVLRMECKTVNANGGIQFRSERVPDSREVSGYQADMDSSGTYWGCLYDESRRGMLAETDREALAGIVDPTDWNDYEVRCEGARIQLRVNGHLTVEYVEQDPDIARTGIIAVQVHAGEPSETWYRNIRIAELP